MPPDNEKQIPINEKADTHKRKTAAGTHPTAALTDFPKTNFSFSLKQLNLKTNFFFQNLTNHYLKQTSYLKDHFIPHEYSIL